MSDNSVPVIDIGPFRNGTPEARAAVARRLNAACLETGFFSVVGHGIPESLTGKTRDLSAAFFGLPITEKSKTLPARRAPRGYSPPGSRSLSYTREGVEAPPDLQESFAVTPRMLGDWNHPLGDFRLACGGATPRMLGDWN